MRKKRQPQERKTAHYAVSGLSIDSPSGFFLLLRDLLSNFRAQKVGWRCFSPFSDGCHTCLALMRPLALPAHAPLQCDTTPHAGARSGASPQMVALDRLPCL